MKRPGHKFTSRNLCAGRSSAIDDDDVEMKEPQTKHLLQDDGAFSPSLPSSPHMNGTDFTKHKVRSLNQCQVIKINIVMVVQHHLEVLSSFR